MPRLGDTFLANLSAPRSVEDVAAIALALDQEAESRCSALARELRHAGSADLAALLDELGAEHRAHADRLKGEAASGAFEGSAPKDLARLLHQSLAEDGAGADDIFSLTPYRVLARAVSLAQQSFTLYSYLAAAAENKVRDYAQHLASEQLSRAARLRVQRRRAYHAGRGQADAEAYPAAGLIESEADLLAAALAIEDRIAQRLARAEERQAGLSPTRRATQERVETLRRASEQAGEANGRLAEILSAFSQGKQPDPQAGQDGAVPTRPPRADCERAFTFYDAVASAPADEAVMLRAQDLSHAAVERIRALS